MKIKQFPILGACGIVCGLCPRLYTDGPSRCPGCFGEDFSKKHPSCSIITCCVKQKEMETCGTCSAFPCSKMTGIDTFDSFVSHKKCFDNLMRIKNNGMHELISEIRERIEILKILIENHNDGKSKSFFCLSTALLPLEDLRKEANKWRTGSSPEQVKNDLRRIGKENEILLTLRKKG